MGTTGVSALPAGVIDDFASGLRGQAVRPGDGHYDDVRRVRNGLIDRQPGLIVRCHGTADVVDAVNFARDQNLLATVRGGGHNVAGNAVNDDCHLRGFLP